jgi:Heterokaryon incompatibility protein (HET)
LKDGSAASKTGYEKLLGTCSQAARDEYDWIWIDSCCIDKSSSSELQEAINSMWNWYKRANICYAYLSDVPDWEAGWDERFGRSRWFTRGWTLQELIAPSSVEFYARDWTPIGTKLERLDEVHSITGIDIRVLHGGYPPAM